MGLKWVFLNKELCPLTNGDDSDVILWRHLKASSLEPERPILTKKYQLDEGKDYLGSGLNLPVSYFPWFKNLFLIFCIYVSLFVKSLSTTAYIYI